MKKLYTLGVSLLCFLGSQAQSIGTQTFTASGSDDDPTVVTVNIADITVNQGQAINSITFTNSAGSLTSGFCADWYDFTLSIDGTPTVSNGCSADLNGQVVTGFSTLTLTSNDIDAVSDGVTITFDLEVNYVTPTCPKPTALMVSQITSSGADVMWTPGGASLFNIEYGVAGFTQGSGTTVSGVANPFTLSGLMSNTNYDVYVQDDCGGGDVSAWSLVSFITSPTAHAFPLTEDFEDSTLFFENDANGDTPWMLTSVLAHAGTMSVFNGYGANDDNILHETGILDLSATGAPVLEFWHIAKTEGFWDECYVEISTDGGVSYNVIPSANYRGSGNYVGNFWEDSYSDWGTSTEVPTNDWWKKETFDLRDYNVPNVRVRFRLSSDGSGQRTGWFIDDLTIFEPTCPNPYNFASAYQNEDSVVLNWNAGFNESMWSIEYGPVGFAPGSGVTVIAADTTDTIAGLDLGAVYEFYVQADCGGGDVSDMVGPIIVATPITNDEPCDAIVVLPNTDYSARVFSNINATTQPSEASRVPGTGTHNNTVWFKTVVPNSGHILIATCGSDFTTRLGVYAADTAICDSLETFGFIDYNTSDASLCSPTKAALEICGANPGDSLLFFVGGSFSTQEGIISLTVTDLNLEGYAGEGNVEPVSVCTGDTVDLFSQLTGQLLNDGEWIYPSNPSAIINGDMVSTGSLTLNGNEVFYTLENGCDQDTATVTIDAVSQTNTGMAVSNFQACSNGDVFLFDGLTGSIDAGGTWSTGTGAPFNGSKFIASGLPDGPYQFTYSVDNGVCPPATTDVVVNLVNCTGISEDESTTFGVYPNPNDGTFFISNGNLESNIVMNVLDVQGKVIFNSSYVMAAGSQQEVSLGNVESGVYIVRIVTNNQVFNSNVVVK